MVHVTLTGRLTRDPELREITDPDSGDTREVCHARVACRDSRGRTVYLDVAQWGSGGRAAAERLTKGSLVAVAGEPRQREVNTDNGRRVYLTIVGRIEFIERTRNGAEPEAAPVDAESDTDPIPF